MVVGALDVLDEHLARLHVHQFQAGEFNARGVVHGKLHPLVGLPSLNGGGGDDVRPVGAVFVLIIGPLPAVADLLIGVVLVLGVGVGDAHQGVPAVTVHRHRVVVQVRGEQGHLQGVPIEAGIGADVAVHRRGGAVLLQAVGQGQLLQALVSIVLAGVDLAGFQVDGELRHHPVVRNGRLFRCGIGGILVQGQHHIGHIFRRGDKGAHAGVGPRIVDVLRAVGGPLHRAVLQQVPSRGGEQGVDPQGSGAGGKVRLLGGGQHGVAHAAEEGHLHGEAQVGGGAFHPLERHAVVLHGVPQEIAGGVRRDAEVQLVIREGDQPGGGAPCQTGKGEGHLYLLVLRELVGQLCHPLRPVQAAAVVTGFLQGEDAVLQRCDQFRGSAVHCHLEGL